MVHSEGWRVSGEAGGERRSLAREHRAAARAEGGGSSAEPRGLGAVGGSGLGGSGLGGSGLGGSGLGGRSRRARWRVAPVFSAWAVLLYACGTNNTYYVEQHIHLGPDAGVASPAPVAPLEPPESSEPAPVDPRPGIEASAEGETPLAGEVDAGSPLSTLGVPAADVSPGALALDVFGALGNHYWFQVSSGQVELMNAPYLGGGNYGDLYTPQGSPEPSFVDHLFVTSAGEASHTADFGKVQVRLVGQSTGRPWTENTLPNFKLDVDEFVEKGRIGGLEHLRLNNAVVGSIYREKLTFDLYRALGYPAPRTAYAWVSASVWGAGIDVPYIAVEAYKPQFCELREAELGGGCVNMWEFYGDIGAGILGLADNCQFSECEPTRALEFEDAVAATPFGDGYKAELMDWVDWDAFHRFQCLSWILETGDDALHNLNNFVLVERADGRFQHLPYSVDISLGQDWYPVVPLGGANTLAMGCQSDAECWADTIATCEVLIDAFTNAAPVAMLDAINTELEQAGMLRPGDGGRYTALRRHIEQRLVDLPVELEDNRDGPSFGEECPYPLLQCGDSCVLYPEDCVVCEPAAPEELPEDDDGASGDDAADAGVDESAPDDNGPDDNGEACLPPIDVYGQPVLF
jgi:hypothetical protein